MPCYLSKLSRKNSWKFVVSSLLLTSFITACSAEKEPVAKTTDSNEGQPSQIQQAKAEKFSAQQKIVGGIAGDVVGVSAVTAPAGKPVVYQVFTRLFGNKNTTNKPWGTMSENGVGKFSDFTDTALQGIKELGVSHIWYTGVPHHALIGDYSEFGISHDDPDVVKGRAGSPYAVKDYYSVNPDLADNPAQRVAEFEALIARTHQQGMKVIIDIVPNHIARDYQSLGKPKGVHDFGANDDLTVEFSADNDFYYVVGQNFKVPKPEQSQSAASYVPLNGEKHPLADGLFSESPAKWTGNGSRAAQPNINDWYETVKVNYGVRPDGSYAFDRLPEAYRFKSYQAHNEFWRNKKVPSAWIKFRDITQFWLDKGVDGFRYDMAEMVPVEFWSYLNSSIKMTNKDAFILAEVYNPKQYRNYIQLGKMDYLYDKVDFYDRLKDIMQGHGNTGDLANIQQRYSDIESHLMHFLENHDEQRIASEGFAGNAEKAKPAMVVSALISRSPTMIYFAQELGEDGSEETGFGDPSRTTIFDYAGVPSHQRWMNGGKFDGATLSDDERDLRDFYQRLLTISAENSATNGQYVSLHDDNRKALSAYNHQQFAFARWQGEEKLIVVSNFDSEQRYQYSLQIPKTLVKTWQLPAGQYHLNDLLYGKNSSLTVNSDHTASIELDIAPLGSYVFQLAVTK
ncbi:alpha-amylase [Colwellia sp. Arc7-635]|uniref:alpha-amylase family glycosyl hydrolase n=1 Tax=Colwellia sp. Arc7-635 TaxID=2497879 RepID=UPI000F84EF16|nr:alpha-amylase family glycosyl hydrolase [Colwellia sp. Arc7-635]AZQ83968.1 alpha-amylase [Colwellia sp. Arc7-635]